MKQLARTVSLIGVFCGSVALHADTTAVTDATATASQPSTASERAAKTTALRAQIAADGQKLIVLRAQARKSNDVIKLNCVNDKLVQAKAVQNIADSAGPTGAGTDGQAAFAQLVAAGDSMARLREDAEECVGAQELYKQEVGGTVEPEVVDDPTQMNPFGGGEVEPPVSASK